MPYAVINKRTESVRLFGSLPSLATAFGLDLDDLQTVFGRYKKTELTIGELWIVRAKLERSERKQNLIKRELKKHQKEKLNELIRNMAMLNPDDKIAETEKFDDDFGFDSLDNIEFVMEVEKQFEINVSDEEAEKVETVKDAYDLLAALL